MVSEIKLDQKQFLGTLLLAERLSESRGDTIERGHFSLYAALD